VRIDGLYVSITKLFRAKHLLEVQIVSLDPFFIRILDPFEIHDFEIKTVLGSELVMSAGWKGCGQGYLVLGSRDIADDHVRDVGP